MIDDIRNQMETMVVLDDLVDEKHPFRAYDRVVDFAALARPLEALLSDQARREIGAERGLRMLFLQFLEDLSDCQMEWFVRDRSSARWFCNFGLLEKTPDHPWFGEFRDSLGSDGLKNIIDVMREAMTESGQFRGAFTHIYADNLESKLKEWSERDGVPAAGC